MKNIPHPPYWLLLLLLFGQAKASFDLSVESGEPACWLAEARRGEQVEALLTRLESQEPKAWQMGLSAFFQVPGKECFAQDKNCLRQVAYWWAYKRIEGRLTTPVALFSCLAIFTDKEAQAWLFLYLLEALTQRAQLACLQESLHYAQGQALALPPGSSPILGQQALARGPDSLGILEALIDTLGLDPKEPNLEGFHLGHWAAFYDQEELLAFLVSRAYLAPDELLISCGALPSPLSMAVRNYSAGTTRFIMEACPVEKVKKELNQEENGRESLRSFLDLPVEGNDPARQLHRQRLCDYFDRFDGQVDPRPSYAGGLGLILRICLGGALTLLIGLLVFLEESNPLETFLKESLEELTVQGDSSAQERGGGSPGQEEEQEA